MMFSDDQWNSMEFPCKSSPFTLREDNGRLSSGLTCSDCSCQRAEISQHVITEAMNNQLATDFRTYFQLPAAAGAFGLMNE